MLKYTYNSMRCIFISRSFLFSIRYYIIFPSFFISFILRCFYGGEWRGRGWGVRTKVVPIICVNNSWCMHERYFEQTTITSLNDRLAEKTINSPKLPARDFTFTISERQLTIDSVWQFFFFQRFNIDIRQWRLLN